VQHKYACQNGSASSLRVLFTHKYYEFSVNAYLRSCRQHVNFRRTNYWSQDEMYFIDCLDNSKLKIFLILVQQPSLQYSNKNAQHIALYIQTFTEIYRYIYIYMDTHTHISISHVTAVFASPA